MLAAAVLRGFTGFGFALAAVPLLGMLQAPAEAVPLAIALQFLGGLVDLRPAARLAHWPSLRWLMAGAVVGSPLGMLLLGAVSPALARVLIGAITLSAVLVLGLGRPAEALGSPGPTVGAGFLAGLFNGLAGMPGPPAVAYYMALPIGAPAVRASLLVFFLATSVAALASAAALGLLAWTTMLHAAVLLPVMIVGTALGGRAFSMGSARTHRLTSIGVLAVIGLTSLLRGLQGLG